MRYLFKHEIRDDITQLLIFQLDFVKPQVRFVNLIVRDEGDRLTICINWPFSPAMEGHDANAKTAAVCRPGRGRLSPVRRPC